MTLARNYSRRIMTEMVNENSDTKMNLYLFARYKMFIENIYLYVYMYQCTSWLSSIIRNPYRARCIELRVHCGSLSAKTENSTLSRRPLHLVRHRSRHMCTSDWISQLSFQNSSLFLQHYGKFSEEICS